MKNTQRELATLVDQLQPENKDVFEYIEEYITDSDLYDEATCQSLLVDIATHFVEAEKQGVSAQEVVGNDPAKYCRELGQNLPRRPGAYRRLLVLAVAWTVMTVLAAGALVLELLGNHQPALYAASLGLFPLSIGIYAAMALNDEPKPASIAKAVSALIITALISIGVFWVFGFILTKTSTSGYVTSLIIDSIVMIILWHQIIQNRTNVQS